VAKAKAKRALLFEVVKYRQAAASEVLPRVTLTTNTWDDYGYKTTFNAVFHNSEGESTDLGWIKILQRGADRTQLEPSFERLGDGYCSLGGDADYYRRLAALDSVIAEAILGALRDVAVDDQLRASFEHEPGFETSLLRFQEARDALDEGAKLFRGRQRRQDDELAFTFRTRLKGFVVPHELTLQFARARALGRTTVLIGANGTGKTGVLGRLAYALVGLIDRDGGESLEPTPSLPGGVLAVSWSAFDRFEIPRGELPTRYFYCGLRVFEVRVRAASSEDKPRLRGRGRYERLDLEHCINQALEALLLLSKRERVKLRETFVALELGPDKVCRDVAGAEDGAALADALHRLSAGQKLVACTLIHLRARLEPGTMVLFDEPEAHLHPSLLSGLVRELNELLEARDSFAIVATHSPLVLQETPARHVVVLDAENGVPQARGYAGETFGETISFLMDSVFRVGGEQRNWRAIIEVYRDSDRLEELKAVLRPALNLPLAGILFDEGDE
jgi:predicted ATPase